MEGSSRVALYWKDLMEKEDKNLSLFNIWIGLKKYSSPFKVNPFYNGESGLIKEEWQN
jgi:hypothetical protein